MKKGVGALEIIFGMFILIIVVLVLIRMFTAIVTPKKITEQLESFESAYQITAEKAACNQACDTYLDNGCSRRDAVDFCLKKIKVDIDGNKLPGERYHGNFVRNLPYCEDGLFCFHVSDCKCGNYKLTAENCLRILCDYYQIDEGLSNDVAVKLISNKYNGIFFGTCDKNPKNWGLDYEPPSNLLVDWWWDNSGYDSTSCSNIQTGASQTGGIKLECVPSGNYITCSWSGCLIGDNTMLNLGIKKEGSPPETPSTSCKKGVTGNTEASGTCQTGILPDPVKGNYIARLTCDSLDAEVPKSTTQNIVI